MFNEKWKAALTGAAISGLFGPGAALLLLEFQMHRPSSFRQAAVMTVLVLKGDWIFAVIAVGPAAFVLGGVCGVLLQGLVRRVHSMKVALAQAAVLGLVLGSVVPVVTFFIASFFGPRDSSYSLKQDIFSALPVAALTGIICALLLLWLFHATQLLYRRG
jgi:hypothetical protein